jgi:aflatoxin B1 aldehyde reductase
VQTIYDICKKEGYIMPTIYEGGYNPLMRNADDFYAFSPLCGGYFLRTAE